jgi:hypothetical protein
MILESPSCLPSVCAPKLKIELHFERGLVIQTLNDDEFQQWQDDITSGNGQGGGAKCWQEEGGGGDRHTTGIGY